MPNEKRPLMAGRGARLLVLAAAALLGLLLRAAPALPLGGVVLPTVDTAITAGPTEGSTLEGEETSFSFAATRDGAPFSGAAFKCSLDGQPARPCSSPLTLEALDDGPHTFAVFAEDPQSGAVDPTPAGRSFSVAPGEEGCEIVEDEEGNEEEIGCEEEGKNGGAGTPPPAACLLRSARARLFTYASQDRVRLVIRYTSFAPADVRVAFRLGSGKGGHRLGSAEQRFARKGVFRLGVRLSDAETAKVREAKGFTVTMTIPAAPDLCRSYETRHLTIRRSVHGQIVWFQSDSVFGTSG